MKNPVCVCVCVLEEGTAFGSHLVLLIKTNWNYTVLSVKLQGK